MPSPTGCDGHNNYGRIYGLPPMCTHTRRFTCLNLREAGQMTESRQYRPSNFGRLYKHVDCVSNLAQTVRVSRNGDFPHAYYDVYIGSFFSDEKTFTCVVLSIAPIMGNQQHSPQAIFCMLHQKLLTIIIQLVKLPPFSLFGIVIYTYSKNEIMKWI